MERISEQNQEEIVAPHNYIKELVQLFSKELAELGLVDDPNKINVKTFRVAVKKIRAIALFVEYIDDELKVHDDFCQIIPMYKKLGIIRDHSLYIKRATKTEQKVKIDLAEYKNFLEQIISHELESFHIADYTDHLQKVNGALHAIKHTLSGFNPKELEYYGLMYLGILDAHAKSLAETIHTEEDIHSFRKIIKQKFHIIQLCSMQTKYEDYEGLKRQQRTFGKWNDRINFKLSLLDFLTESVNDISNFGRYTRFLKKLDIAVEEWQVKVCLLLENDYETIIILDK